MKLVLPTGSHPRPCGGVHQKEANFGAQKNWRTEGREEKKHAKRKRLLEEKRKKKEEAEHKKKCGVLFDGVINKAEGHSW